jgi:hypothetical protein
MLTENGGEATFVPGDVSQATAVTLVAVPRGPLVALPYLILRRLSSPTVAARRLRAHVPHSTDNLASYLLIRRIFSRLTRMIPLMVPTPSADTRILVLSESSTKFLLP